jgi:hypothetical protein
MRICYHNELPFACFHFRVHLLVLGLCKLVSVELEILVVLRMVDVEPQDVNLEFIFGEVSVPFHQSMRISPSPLRKVEAQRIGRRHLRVSSDISKLFMYLLCPIPSKNKQLQHPCFRCKTHLSTRLSLFNIDPRVCSIDPRYRLVPLFGVCC